VPRGSSRRPFARASATRVSRPRQQAPSGSRSAPNARRVWRSAAMPASWWRRARSGIGPLSSRGGRPRSLTDENLGSFVRNRTDEVIRKRLNVSVSSPNHTFDRPAGCRAFRWMQSFQNWHSNARPPGHFLKPASAPIVVGGCADTQIHPTRTRFIAKQNRDIIELSNDGVL
jgi:hypothetical protein